MNQQMWHDQATQDNLTTLGSRNIAFVGPAEGEQACGDVGPGRMEEPALIAERAATMFSRGLLEGKRILITAGPTREALDPVRYISNHSSGKMGFALAEAAVDAGAVTTVVCGPVSLQTPEHVHRLNVHSAVEMLDQCQELLKECDIFIACAAVADYRPASTEQQKIKKGAEHITLDLVRNPDIVATVAAANPRPFTVGFAAETHDVLAYAKGKMERKQLDMIIANDVSSHNIGFNSDENEVTVIWHGGEKSLERARKSAIARQIMALIAAATGASE
jgi:phosphopantothenoylcysteine decarboxylase/phosphopantothenate--cysteine ligase